MSYPNPQAYSDALQMAAVSVLDSKLRSGRVETDPLGLPFGRTGAFAITFKIAAGGTDYAFRCFLTNRATIHERYDAISSHLKGIQLPYFVDFTYLDEGIRVDNKVYPTVRMSWASGMPLGLYIQEHHADNGRMTALQQQIQGMAQALSAAGLAHGDIQGGNLLIGDRGAITLVDYDGMYVPSIANLGAIETGHPNFQHPERASSKPYDAKVDRFSFALLHTVIAALIERPSLWTQLNSDPDKILLGESDIASPFSSPAFATLTSLPSSGTFATSLQAIASAPFSQVPDFTDFLNHRNIPAPGTHARSSSTPNSKSSSNSAPWYAEHIARGDSGQEAVTATSDSYTAAHPILDASDSSQWIDSPASLVEVIGQVAHVEVGYSGTRLPFTRLFLHRGNPNLTIDVWAEGLRRFAQEGITVDGSWNGQWIAARGVVFGPVGSGGGEGYAITMVEPDRLERINAHQARWRLSTRNSASSTATEARTASNADALHTLTSSKRAKDSSPSSPAPTPPKTTGTSSTGSLDTSQAKIWLIIGAIAAAALALIIILGSTGALASFGGAPGYETCVSSDLDEGFCVDGLTWEYRACWQPDEVARILLQRGDSGGGWTIADQYFATRDDCMPDFPWTVAFSRTEVGPGQTTYRLYTGDTGALETLRVSVTAK